MTFRSRLLWLAEKIAQRYGYMLVEQKSFERAGAGVGYLDETFREYGFAARIGKGAGRQARWNALEAIVTTVGRCLTVAGSRAW